MEGVQPTGQTHPDGKQDNERQGIMMERTLHVSITNSLGNLALAGPHGGLWKPVDGLQLKLLPIWIPRQWTQALQRTNSIVPSSTR